jgi:phosphoglycolate phosphatase-like HAD superfamily hydrolase
VYGFEHLCKERYQFNNEEMLIEYTIWKSFTQSKQAQPFDGWKELLNTFRNQGGKIVVVSYSESKEILRDYQDHFGFKPDLIFAYDHGPEKLKPHTYPIYTLMETLQINTDEILVIDDMPVGYEMAQKAQVDFIWAQWAFFDDTLNEHIKKTSYRACNNVYTLFEIMELSIN